MNDKVVTHADGRTIELLALTAKAVDLTVEERGRVDEFLARAKAAAEADAPPLPEGWVLFRYRDGAHGVFYYPGHGDVLTRYDDGNGEAVPVEAFRDRLTPLRPTVTEADVEKAAEAYRDDRLLDWGDLHVAERESYVRSMRAAFAAAGIEVSGR